MIEGIRCPPATHEYRVLGKILFCTRCADVQPLVLEEPAAVSPPGSVWNNPPEPAYDRPLEPTAADMEAHIARLREAAGLAERQAEQQDLFGARRDYEGDLADLEMAPPTPRGRVDAGYRTDPHNESLPAENV